jgi:hypothetical protein
MGPFVLLLLTLNPHTGDLLSSSVVGSPYESIADCMRAAVARGPVKATDNQASLLVCRAPQNDYTWSPTVPGGQT